MTSRTTSSLTVDSNSCFSSFLPTIIRIISSILISLAFVVPWHFPSRITVILSATSNTSVSICDMYMMDTPLPVSSFMSENNNSFSVSVIVAVGSSSRRSCGSCDKAFAISTICCFAGGSSPTKVLALMFPRLSVSKNCSVIAVNFLESISLNRLTGWRAAKIFSATFKPSIRLLS